MSGARRALLLGLCVLAYPTVVAAQTGRAVSVEELAAQAAERSLEVARARVDIESAEDELRSARTLEESRVAKEIQRKLDNAVQRARCPEKRS